MTQIGQIYKCAICGNTVEVKAAGIGELVCCGQPMGLVTEKQETPIAAETMPEVKPEDEITEVAPNPSPSEEPEPQA